MSCSLQSARLALALGSTLCTSTAWTQDALKHEIRQRGIEPHVTYISEAAANVTGGADRVLRETGELDVGARLDMDKLFGIRGGTFQAMVTWRRGDNLVSDAGLDTLELVQANYGRGQTTRLTQFWYQQQLAEGRVDVKLGRLTAGEDFAAFSCDFMNLGLCGARPGSVVSDYWYNWPISQWGMRWRYRVTTGYAQIGAFEVNPKNLEENFTIGRFSGATGVLLPVEVAFTPTLGASLLPGTYKLGAWYDTSTADDAFLDVDGAPRALSELPALQRHGRYGAYAQIRQQLTTDGLAVFLNVVQAEKRASKLDRQIGIGLTYTNPSPGSALDGYGVAVTATHVNSRFARYKHLLDHAEHAADTEYLAEAFVRWVVAPWLTVQPNVQYIVAPGGYSDRSDAGIIGLRVTASFD
ncbi:MAG TPA: carbohydrate porin [Steroidobacter sp.]|uniref:carbohydrate porin n=1 Tax=Steroidobacter sp. TaxID=1978227 RepID=UPI002ED9ED9A